MPYFCSTCKTEIVSVKIMHIEIQNCFSFWGTSSPRPPTGASPLDPTGGRPPHIVYQVYAPGWRASDIITPLTRVAFVYNGPKGIELAPNAHYSGGIAKALEGSFKLVTLTPRTVREMTQLPKETKRRGHKQVFLANHLASTDNLTRTTKIQNT